MPGLVVRHGGRPQHLAGLRIERDQLRIQLRALETEIRREEARVETSNKKSEDLQQEMRKLTEDDPARRQMALDFQHHIDELFNFGGARQDGAADQVSISISREARKMAGFTDEEIDRLVQAASASVAY